MMNIIKRCWRGEEKLWKVFWLWAFLPSIIKFLIGVFFGVTASLGQQNESLALQKALQNGLPIIHGLPWHIGYAVYYGIFFVCVLRCFSNVRHKFWAYLAMIVAIFFLVLAVGGLYGKILANSVASESK